MTKVIFRVDENGHAIAFFPGIAGTSHSNFCLCYQHAGQHSSANMEYITKWTRPASPDEYKDLLSELVSVGYNDLKIVKRASKKDLEKRLEQIK